MLSLKLMYINIKLDLIVSGTIGNWRNIEGWRDHNSQSKASNCRKRK